MIDDHNRRHEPDRRHEPEGRHEPEFVDQFRKGGGQSYRPGGGGGGGGGGERSPQSIARGDSYRARSPPPARRDFAGDTYRARPRSRSPPPRRDEYRRRSPNPPRYGDTRDVRGGDTYRARPRSPPLRREDLPRDDLFRRQPEPARDFRDSRDYRDEPARDYRDDRRAYGARSPAPRHRDRSPIPLKRGREPSPIGSRGRRTPPPAKRERLASPVQRNRYDYPPSRAASPPRRRFSPEHKERRSSPARGVTRDYRMRSRSPPARIERVDPRTIDDWRRPRSPSPPHGYTRPDYMDVDQGRDSVATSRRSSPPVHPSRVASMQPAMDERASRPPPRDPYDSRESYRPRSPEPVRRRDSLPRREFADGGYAGVDDRIPPPREPHRADDVPPPRAPPSGPAGYRAPSSTMAPPSGPAAAVSVSAHTRAPAAPPIGPRGSLGAPHMSRGDFGPPRGRGGFRGSFGGAFRGGRGGPPPPFGRGETFNRESFDANAGGPPAGPRGSLSQAGPPPLTFRPSNNSTATTYPRSQRFAPNGQPIPDGPSSTPPTGPRAGRGPPSAPAAATADDHRRVSAPAVHPAMSNLPKVIEGGQSADALVDDTRLRKLQEESERLRRQIEEKEQKKRKSLREWDRMSREVEVASLRSELAEQSLRELNGEAESQAAF